MKQNILKIILFLCLGLFISSCATTQKTSKTSKTSKKSIHGKEKLIDPSEVIVQGREEMDEMVRIGPKPYDAEFEVREDTRKTITTEEVRNYVTIPEDYGNLKQSINLNLNNVDFSYVMALMADIGEINILYYMPVWNCLYK